MPIVSVAYFIVQAESLCIFQFSLFQITKADEKLYLTFVTYDTSMVIYYKVSLLENPGLLNYFVILKYIHFCL